MAQNGSYAFQLIDEIKELKEENEKLKEQIERMKCCQNCNNWNWKHNKCVKKLKGDCFKRSKWEMKE